MTDNIFELKGKSIYFHDSWANSSLTLNINRVIFSGKAFIIWGENSWGAEDYIAISAESFTLLMRKGFAIENIPGECHTSLMYEIIGE